MYISGLGIVLCTTLCSNSIVTTGVEKNARKEGDGFKVNRHQGVVSSAHSSFREQGI